MVQTLSSTAAFGSGFDLWILPEVSHSPWARKLDWYLNLQILRAHNFSKKSLNPELQAIIQENELKLATDIRPSKAGPLMIATSQRLPMRQVVEVPMLEDLNAWLSQALGIWRDLGYPSLKIFLPKGLNMESLAQTLSGQDAHYTVACVPGDLALDA